MKPNNEPIRHHYIPQFILKKFKINNENKVFYFDKNTSKVIKKSTQDIFMTRNLYRDNINDSKNPTYIEKNMAKFENEVSKILQKGFFDAQKIEVSLEENEKLLVFFAIMAFRSKFTGEKFEKGLSEETKLFYKKYQRDENFSDFWKRNLGKLVECRSLNEIMQHKEIDDPIKIFFRRDIVGLFGLYLIVAERRGNQEFILSDVYPLAFSGELENKMKLHMYSVLPISPDRIILIASNGVKNSPRNVLVLRKEVFNKPRVNSKGIITLYVKKIYENEVQFLNNEAIKNTDVGFIFKNEIFQND